MPSFRIILAFSLLLCIFGRISGNEGIVKTCYSGSNIQVEDPDKLEPKACTPPTASPPTMQTDNFTEDFFTSNTPSEPTLAPEPASTEPSPSPTNSTANSTKSTTNSTTNSTTIELLTTNATITIDQSTALPPTLLTATTANTNTTVKAGDTGLDPGPDPGPVPSRKRRESKTEDTSNDTDDDSIQYCYIFEYPINETLSFNKPNFAANFSCDFEDYCDGKKVDTHLEFVEINGINGTLYCCDSSNCNDMNNAQHLQPLPKTVENCYQDDGDSASPTIQKCPDETFFCLNETIGDTVSYSCDFSGLCDEIGCTHINNNYTLCCCDEDSCNKGDESKEPDNSPGGGSSVSPAYVVLYVLAALVTVLVVAFVAKAVCKRRRGNSKNGNGRLAESTQMTYSRLTEELAASESY